MNYIVLILCIILLPLLSFLFKLYLDKNKYEAEKKLRNEDLKKMNEVILLKENFLKEEIEKNLILEKEKTKLETILTEKEKNEVNLKRELEAIGVKIVESTRVKSNNESLDILSQTIKPFKDELENVRKKIEEDSKEKIDFKGAFTTQVKIIQDEIKNQSEASLKLTNALNQKPQQAGRWGEEILERILDSSGLIEGENYTKQNSSKGEDGSIQRPDIVFNSNGGSIIIDSKLSILNYNNYCNSTNEDEKELYKKELLKNTKSHIDLLSNKEYQKTNFGNGKNIIGNIIMFIPVEAVYYLITQEKEQKIHEYAWNKNIILAGPYNLIAILRAINSIIKIEKKTKNMEEASRIINNAADKITVFLNEFKSLSEFTEKQHSALNKKIEDMNTKVEGKGGFLPIVQNLQKLGFGDKRLNIEEVKIENKIEQQDSDKQDLILDFDNE